jgi:hypothetical protein
MIDIGTIVLSLLLIVLPALGVAQYFYSIFHEGENRA